MTSESPDISALTARLERLETAEAARAVIYRYAEGADTRDWAVLGSAFAEDAILVMPESQVDGRAAIVGALRDMLPAEFVTLHLMVNPHVTWTAPGRARVTSTVYYMHEGSGFEALGWGDYLIDVTVVDGVGRISRMAFTPTRHLPGSVATVVAKVERLETIELARQATWRYATAVDTADLALLSAVFTEDAVLTTRRGSRQGRDEVVEYYRLALADAVDRRHFMANQSATWLEPGRAQLDSYFLYTYAGADTSILGWGAYHDIVTVIDGVGLIESKTISVDVHADTRVGWAAGSTT